MILWLIDRMGLPGQYRVAWSRLMRDNHIPTTEIRFLSLHRELPGQLLTRFMTRKAPTWLPHREQEIINAINFGIDRLKARAVVLSSPESLACLGLAPEHATLHNLRGSVYQRHGVPHLVMLPMSAWFSMVTQKDIGAANFGFESEDEFKNHKEQVHAQGTHSNGSGRSNNDSGHSPSRATGRGLLPSHASASQRDLADGGRSQSEADSRGSGGNNGGDMDQVSGRDARYGGEESESGRQADLRLGDVDDDDDDVAETSVATESDTANDDDVDEDGFFYEPVLSPVGRFAITADTQKLYRILNSTGTAGGPVTPIKLRW